VQQVKTTWLRLGMAHCYWLELFVFSAILSECMSAKFYTSPDSA